MNILASQMNQYFIIVADSIAAGILFAAFSSVKQKWKVLCFAGLMILIRLLLLFTMTDIHYISKILMIGAVFFASFGFFPVSIPIRVFLTCCFWAVTEVCTFIAFGPQTAVNSAVMEIISYGIENQTLTALESIQQFFNINAIVAAGVFTVTRTIFLLLILCYVVKNFTYKNFTLRRTEILYLLLPCFSSIAVTQILQQVLLLSGETAAAILNNMILMIFLIPAAGVVLLFSIAASVKLYQNLIRLHMEETDKKVLEKQIVQIKEQVQDVQDIYGDIRGIRHDMANHLLNIRSLIQAGVDNQEELDGYIGKLEDNLDALRFGCQTGHPITDVIIHQKMLESRNKRINFESDFLFPEMLNIDSVDIAVILCNALDNAFEACRSMQEVNENRYVKLSAYKKGVMFFIETENSFCGSLNFDETSRLPLSSKTDGGPHGIGLTNIKRCADKYFGDISIMHGDGVFFLTVMLQGRV